MGKADLHIHSIYSWDGTCAVSAVLKQAAHVAHLDVIAITDHDEIKGSLEAQELAADYGIEVIAGSEITTADGHLLALFIQEKIPAGKSLVETVLRVREQGGLCVVPHPEALGTHSVNRTVLKNALTNNLVAESLRGLEVFNAGLFDHKANTNAELIARENALSRIGSSDSHQLWTIGLGLTLFHGRSANDLRSAIQAGQTDSVVVNQPGIAPIIFSWLRSHLLRRMGWVEHNRSPELSVRLEKISMLARFALAEKSPQ